MLRRICLRLDGYVSFFFFSSRRRHTRCSRDWSSDVCSSDLVCEIAQIFDVRKPNEKLAAIKRAMHTTGSLTIAAGRMAMLPTRPPTAKVLRTRVGVAPLLIQQSDSQPPITEEVAIVKNGSEPA